MDARTERPDEAAGLRRARSPRTGHARCSRRPVNRGGDAELLALGENAVFALDAPPARPVVVRIGRGPWLRGRAERELRVAAWLEEQDVPAVRAARPGVTRRRRASADLLAAPARPRTGGRARAISRRCCAACTLCPRRRSRCRGASCCRASRGGCGLPGTRCPLRTRPICAARSRRLRRRRRRAGPGTAARPAPRRRPAAQRPRRPGRPALLDLETFSDDLREHDLTVLALSLDRYGLDADAYSGFVASTAGTCASGPAARCCGARGRRRAARGWLSTRRGTRRPAASSRAASPRCGSGTRRCAGTPSSAGGPFCAAAAAAAGSRTRHVDLQRRRRRAATADRCPRHHRADQLQREEVLQPRRRPVRRGSPAPS